MDGYGDGDGGGNGDGDGTGDNGRVNGYRVHTLTAIKSRYKLDVLELFQQIH